MERLSFGEWTLDADREAARRYDQTQPVADGSTGDRYAAYCPEATAFFDALGIAPERSHVGSDFTLAVDRKFSKEFQSKLPRGERPAGQAAMLDAYDDMVATDADFAEPCARG